MKSDVLDDVSDKYQKAKNEKAAANRTADEVLNDLSVAEATAMARMRTANDNMELASNAAYAAALENTQVAVANHRLQYAQNYTASMAEQDEDTDYVDTEAALEAEKLANEEAVRVGRANAKQEAAMNKHELEMARSYMASPK